MEEFPADARHILPFLAIMETSDREKRMEEQVTTVADKLCPFDKQPCIRERCEVFREEQGVCSFCLISIPERPCGSSKDDRTSSKYKAHLFD